MAASRFAFTIDEPRRARLKGYADARGVSAAAILKAIIDRLPQDNGHEQVDAVKDEPKTNKVTVRLRDNECRSLDEHVQATGFDSRTTWATRVLLQAINKAPAATRDEVNELRRSRSELAAYGRNLNQIAHAMNSNASAQGPTAEMLAELLAAVEDHKAAVTTLMQKVMLRSQQ